MASSDTFKSRDDLYGLPRDEFIAARTVLAKEMAASGDKAGAAEVKQLRKPSVSAAAINLAARRHAEAVDGLLEAGTELRHAQEEALGGGPAEALREATRILASAVDEVAKLAAEEGGVSAAQRDRIATTLRAAATNDDAADRLRRGVLVDDLEAAGFGLDGAPPPPRPKGAKPAKKAEDRADAEALAEARRALRVAEDEADTAERRAVRQAERAGEAERRADEALAAAKEARADAKRMAAEAKEARERADAASRHLDKLTDRR